ncbi:tetratricopeptide repeat-containing sensor histidine kinase [Carboxylicivirga mesophila]|uniref:histidine kinase n=1 Tax=Carboxylicivirga mesophila TaxID=1166478 RepID=A0ABS5KER6_9BACT|nr:tetratricopeptide repeat-containing sensor histidine kinase [Carboxylicivirga mesophila]MBS2213337.1 tetratricopeptide repeat-containing sensor histidine kinase [Carboxylicivirga mesophila]
MPYNSANNIRLCRKAFAIILFTFYIVINIIALEKIEFDATYNYVKEIIREETYQTKIDSLIEAGSDTEKGCVYLIIASNYRKAGNYLASDSCLLLAKGFFIDLNASKGVGYCNYYHGNNAASTEKHEESIVYYKNAISDFKQCDFFDGIVLCCSKLATFFSQKSNFIEAQQYLDLGKSYLDKVSRESLKISFLLNNAAFYAANAEADKAKVLYHSILSDYENNLSKKRKANIYNNLASIYVNLKQWNKALKYYNKSLFIKKEVNDSLGVVRTKQNLLRYYINLNQLSEAREINRQLSTYFEKDTSDYDTYVDFLYNQIKFYSKTNNSEKTLQALNTYFIAEKQRTNSAFSDKLIEMQKSFDLKEKDQEIALLQKEDDLNQARLKTKNILIAVTGSFLLVLILVGYLINRQRKELAQSRRRLLRQKEDITGMNEQLRVSNLAKDRILSVIGHDLRGPVGGLKELIELYMELPEYEPNDIKNLLKAARESSTSTYHLLENLLSWANSQRGDIVFNPVATPLAPLIKQSVQLLDRSINVRNVRFEYDIPQALVIQVDMNMLRTIIRNLVSNALKYSPDNGLIKIMVIEDGKQVKFCICDQGKGMTADETKSIFKKKETYFIGSELTAKGTGLGLILCKEFVERHGGAIWINSEEGIGTQVWFSIPQKGVSTAKVGELQSSAAQ